MQPQIAPLSKTNLADDLADRLVALIRDEYGPGDRLPSIMKMAKAFGVGHPTLREALKKLEMVGVVTIRHGSGVYVGDQEPRLVVSNPVYGRDPSKKMLLDLIEARMPIEVTAAGLAATTATEADLARMATLLEEASEHLHDDAMLSKINMDFHQAIAAASDNMVLTQIQGVLTDLFAKEQRIILDIYGSREKDHHEHVGLLNVLRQRDAERARRLMRAHLEGVRDAVLAWDPTKTPIQ